MPASMKTNKNQKKYYKKKIKINKNKTKITLSLECAQELNNNFIEGEW